MLSVPNEVELENDPNYFMDPDDPYRIDEYWPERPDNLSVAYLSFLPIPEYEGMRYLPPPFRNRYEI